MNILDRGDFLIGFRPEQFVPKEIANVQETLVTFPFETTRVEYLGADQLIYGKLSDTAEGSFIVAKLSSELHFPIDAGRIYDFVVQQKQLRFFDKGQGMRIGPQPI
jgi:multiple sugar transport system ATP-binding protein